MLVYQRAKPSMGYFPYLGQATAPAGRARQLAEQYQSSASSYSLSPKVRDSGKAYPGMLAYQPSDSSLYALSARTPPSGMVVLYTVEGPNTGAWKTISVNDFQNAYRIVDEDEGVALRNLAPAAKPVGDQTDLDIVYPITLLSGAAVTVADSFPTASDIDPAKLADYYQMGLSGAAYAILLATEAIDAAGAAYDALRIGKNALNLVRSVAVEMISLLTKIVGELQKSASDLSGAIQRASKLSDIFMAKVPYWSLLLERASLWVQATDLYGMTRYQSDIHTFDGVLLLALGAINQKSDQLLANGMTPRELVEAKSYIEGVLKNSVDADLDAQRRIQSYLARTKMTKRDLERLSLLTDKFFDDNTNDIVTLLQGPKAPAPVSGFLGSLFMGALGQPKPVLADTLDIARAGRASVRAGFQAGGVDLAKGRPYIEGTLKRFSDLAMRTGYDIRPAIRALGGKLTEQKPEDVVTSLQAQKTLLESKKRSASVSEMKTIESQIASIDKALRIAETNSALLDPKSIERFNDAVSKIVAIRNKVGRTPTPEGLAKLAEGYVSVVLGPEGRELAVDLRKPENMSEFLSLMRDFGDALKLPENGLNTIIYGMVRRSLPGVDFAKGPVSESTAQEIVGSLYKESKNNLSALEAKIASIYDPKMPDYIAASNEEDVMRALGAGTGPFTGSSPIQLAEVREIVDDYFKTRRLANALEAKALWPNGVIEEVGNMLNREFSTIITSDEWKQEAKTLAEAVKTARAEYRKVSQEYNSAMKAAINDPKNAPGPELINSMAYAQKQYEDAFNALKEKVSERKEFAGVYRLLRTMEFYNQEIVDRANRASEAVTAAKANPDPIATAAADNLKTASDKEVTSANVANDNIFKYVATGDGIDVVQNSVDQAAADTKKAEEADTTNALASNAATDASLTPIPEGASRPTLEELSPPGRDEDILPKANRTKLKNYLVGLGALAAIIAGLGTWMAFQNPGDGKKKDPKSHDPVPPPSNVGDLLKVGGVIGGVALLIYFLKKRKSEEPAKKKPAAARR